MRAVSLRPVALRRTAAPVRTPAVAPAMHPAAPLRSDFAGSSSVSGFRTALTGVAVRMEPMRRLGQRVAGLLVEANKKRGLGCTFKGNPRKGARVSGFRARMATPAGRRVLKARRAKGRKDLCPAHMKQRVNKQKI
mmetsp:Transcript_26450/g.86752  ORF Transcript_26450/g.86752 Transcript_26450/m.86752 type:complete len:136 (+) Transcript_26450:30-437(+)